MKNSNKKEKSRNDIKFYFILFLILVTGVVLIYSTYAWFSSSLNVQIYGFNVKVKHDADLAISLDGQDWKESVNISKNTLIYDLTSTYPTHTNRWSDYMTTVSSIGLVDNNYKFGVFENGRIFSRGDFATGTDFLYPRKSDESEPTAKSKYFAFDIFIRNNTNSPYSDNLFIKNEDTLFVPETEDDEYILKALRFGMVYVGTADKKTPLSQIQNMNCTGGMCKQFIYEPNTNHTDGTIELLKGRQINISHDSVIPTYAVYNEGDRVNLWSGVYNSKAGFNNGIFSFQNTITNLNNSVFELPSGISKFRIYIWVEGEDVDVIKTESPGYRLIFGIKFEKDTAGYR